MLAIFMDKVSSRRPCTLKILQNKAIVDDFQNCKNDGSPISQTELAEMVRRKCSAIGTRTVLPPAELMLVIFIYLILCTRHTTATSNRCTVQYSKGKFRLSPTVTLGTV